MKKFISIILVLLLVVIFVSGCGGDYIEPCEKPSQKLGVISKIEKVPTSEDWKYIPRLIVTVGDGTEYFVDRNYTNQDNPQVGETLFFSCGDYQFSN